MIFVININYVIQLINISFTLVHEFNDFRKNTFKLVTKVCVLKHRYVFTITKLKKLHFLCYSRKYNRKITKVDFKWIYVDWLVENRIRLKCRGVCMI